MSSPRMLISTVVKEEVREDGEIIPLKSESVHLVSENWPEGPNVGANARVTERPKLRGWMGNKGNRDSYHGPLNVKVESVENESGTIFLRDIPIKSEPSDFDTFHQDNGGENNEILDCEKTGVKSCPENVGEFDFHSIHAESLSLKSKQQIPNFENSETSSADPRNYENGFTTSADSGNYENGFTTSADSGNYEDGFTTFTVPGNCEDGFTTSSAPGNYEDGFTTSAAPGNYEDGCSTSAAPGNYEDGCTTSAAPGNYEDDFTTFTVPGNYEDDFNILADPRHYENGLTTSAGAGNSENGFCVAAHPGNFENGHIISAQMKSEIFEFLACQKESLDSEQYLRQLQSTFIVFSTENTHDTQVKTEPCGLNYTLRSPDKTVQKRPALDYYTSKYQPVVLLEKLNLSKHINNVETTEQRLDDTESESGKTETGDFEINVQGPTTKKFDGRQSKVIKRRDQPSRRKGAKHLNHKDGFRDKPVTRKRNLRAGNHCPTHAEDKLSSNVVSKDTTGQRNQLDGLVSDQGKKLPFACEICKKGFSLNCRLKAHMFIHSGKRLHGSNFCNKRLTVKRALKRKSLQTHSRYKRFQCEICQKKLATKCSLKNHKFLHTGEKPYSCEICERRFALRTTLDEHMAIHSDQKPYSCPICHKRFAHRNRLNKHKVTHRAVKPHKCTFCSKTFAGKFQLRVHLSTHTGIRPFSCTICGKEFARKHGLKVHMYNHTGERPYGCDLCDKRFMHKFYLKTHKLHHTNEKPFSCEICHKTFRQRSGLTTHLSVHAEPKFACTVCDKKLRCKQSLAQHLLTHSNQRKPFSCTICHKRFTKQYHLDGHMLNHSYEKGAPHGP